MVYPPATRLMKCDLQMDVEYKWSDFVDGGKMVIIMEFEL